MAVVLQVPLGTTIVPSVGSPGVFTRASTGLVYDEGSRTFVEKAIDVPRFEASKGLLMEGANTNPIRWAGFQQDIDGNGTADNWTITGIGGVVPSPGPETGLSTTYKLFGVVSQKIVATFNQSKGENWVQLHQDVVSGWAWGARFIVSFQVLMSNDLEYRVEIDALDGVNAVITNAQSSMNNGTTFFCGASCILEVVPDTTVKLRVKLKVRSKQKTGVKRSIYVGTAQSGGIPIKHLDSFMPTRDGAYYQRAIDRLEFPAAGIDLTKGTITMLYRPRWDPGKMHENATLLFLLSNWRLYYDYVADRFTWQALNATVGVPAAGIVSKHKANQVLTITLVWQDGAPLLLYVDSEGQASADNYVVS